MRLRAELLALGTLCLFGGLAARSAEAHPYAALRPADNVLSGPTDGTLEALWWNPAALRLIRGFRLQALGGASGYLGSYQRAAALPAGFSPGGAAAPAEATPIRWAVPGYLIGGSWDLGTETVVIGAALYTPYGDNTSYANGEDEAQLQRLPTRYHAVNAMTYSMWGSVGAGLRITSWLYLGGGFNFAYTRARRDALRDPDSTADGLGCGTPATCEQWDRRLRLRLNVDGWGFGFSAGALLTPIENRLWIGAAFTSPLFTTGSAGTAGGDQVPLSGQPPEGSPCPAAGPDRWEGARLTGAGRDCFGGAELVYSFPYVVNLGARLRLDLGEGQGRAAPGSVEVTATARLSIPAHRDQQLRLERRAFLDGGGALELPASSYVPVGEQTAFALELGVRQLWERLVLGEAVMYESPRVQPEAVTPANLQGHRLDASVTARLRLHRRLGLLLTAGVTLHLFPDGAGGRLDATLSAACRAAGYDALSAACREVQDGWAQPPAAGRYQLVVPHGAAGIEVRL